MVDTYRTGVSEHGMHHVTVHTVTGGVQIIRIERRLTPILPLLVVEVRRAAHGHATDSESFRIPPHIRT